MNGSQKLGLFILITITICYIYFSYFNKDFEFPKFEQREEVPVYNPVEPPKDEVTPVEEEKPEKKSPKEVKIFILDKSGNLRSVNRTCNTEVESSCFAYAIKELVTAPTKWEKSKGFASEIPQGTKVLSIREGANSIMIDLSQTFETGGGAESTYIRVKQLIKTAKANTNQPVYLYINGKQANVIGGEGLMIKQPLSERSLDE